MLQTEEQQEQVIHRVRSLLNLRIAQSNPKIAGKARSLEFTKAAKWKQLFEQYDKDKNGSLSCRELRKLVRQVLHLGEHSCSDADLQLLFERIDVDQNGVVDFREFCEYVKKEGQPEKEVPQCVGRALRVALMRQRVNTEADFRKLFLSKDVNDDNALSLWELRKVLREDLRLTQHEISEVHIKKLMSSLDLDGSGTIELNEFVKFVREHASFAQCISFAPRKLAAELPTQAPSAVATLPPLKASRLCAALAQPPPPAPAAPSPQPGANADMFRLTGFGPPRPPLEESDGGLSPMPAMQQDRTGNGLDGCARSRAAALGKSQSLPYVGQGRPYLNIKGAAQMNRIEGKLFDAGYDVRGKFFQVPVEADDQKGFDSTRPSGGAKVRQSQLRTMYLHKVAADLLGQ